MSENADITILIAEDNKVSRDMMEGLLRSQGYNTLGVEDGEKAITAVRNKTVDLALVDLNMSPMGGFEFVKFLVAQDIKIPVVIVTADESSDMLVEASALGVGRVLQKPIQPQRLMDTVAKVLERAGLGAKGPGVQNYSPNKTPEQLMSQAIMLARKNLQSGKGGPFGAVVADKDGRIIGEGISGAAGRADPTAHAEVMAIRQAAERLGREDLSDCTLYASSEPTMMGKALIISVALGKVCYALSHEEVKAYNRKEDNVRAEMAKDAPQGTEFVQMAHDEAAAMFQA